LDESLRGEYGHGPTHGGFRPTLDSGYPLTLHTDTAHCKEQLQNALMGLPGAPDNGVLYFFNGLLMVLAV